MRLAKGLTQSELAARVCDQIEHATGCRPPIEAQVISRIECGRITWPSQDMRRALLAILGGKTELDLGLFPKRTQRDSEKEGATKRRKFFALTGLAAPTLASMSGRGVGSTDVNDMRQRYSRLVGLDNYLGGADTFRLYYSELAQTEQILDHSVCAMSVRAELTGLAAQQAQQAGWAAFDAGFTTTAIQLFEYSHRAALEASRPELAANALVHVAYATGTEKSVESAAEVCNELDKRAPVRARALLESRLAWSCAVAGNRAGATRSLDKARQALYEEDSEPAPQWCAWMNHAELDIMTGRVWSVLHEPVKAAAPLEHALSSYPDLWARDKALYLTWLADAYFDAGDVDAAVGTAEKALTLAVGVASVRPLARVREVAARCTDASVPHSEGLFTRAVAARAPVPARL